MSPEQARARQRSVDHRSDIFSLGIVLYEITVGKRLFRGPAQRGRRAGSSTAQIEPPTFVAPRLPAGARGDRDARAREAPRRSLPERVRPRRRPRDVPARRAAALGPGADRALPRHADARGGRRSAGPSWSPRPRCGAARATSSTSTARCSTATGPREGAPGPEQAPRVGGRRAARGRRRRGARHGARRAARAAHAGAGASGGDGAAHRQAACISGPCAHAGRPVPEHVARAVELAGRRARARRTGARARARRPRPRPCPCPPPSRHHQPHQRRQPSPTPSSPPPSRRRARWRSRARWWRARCPRAHRCRSRRSAPRCSRATSQGGSRGCWSGSSAWPCWLSWRISS